MTMTVVAVAKIEKFVLAFVVSAMIAGAVLMLTGCGEGKSPVAPEASPSPSPTPVPPELAVIVRATALKPGVRSGLTTVQQNEEFKINGTATACFLLTVEAPPAPTECPIIPRWKQRVIGGAGADCHAKGSLDSDSVQWYCKQPGDPTFEVCAYDFDQKQLGCDFWGMEVQ